MKYQITSFSALFLEEEVAIVRYCFVSLNRHNVIFCFVSPFVLLKSFIFRFRDLVVTLLRQVLVAKSRLETKLNPHLHISMPIHLIANKTAEDDHIASLSTFSYLKLDATSGETLPSPCKFVQSPKSTTCLT
jgi:hypothetical protein